jgi:tetratricopeptide (TPR) repeat protein
MALADAEAATQVDAHSPAALHVLINLLASTGNREPIARAVHKLLDLAVSDITSIEIAGRQLFELGLYTECLSALARVSKLSAIEALMNLKIECLKRLDRWFEARDLNQEAVEKHPSNMLLSHNLSTIFQRLEDLDGALIYAKRASMLEPKNTALAQRVLSLENIIFPGVPRKT